MQTPTTTGSLTLDAPTTERLKRVLDFLVTFHGDDLPENDPELTRDVQALLRTLQERGHEQFASPLLALLA